MWENILLQNCDGSILNDTKHLPTYPGDKYICVCVRVCIHTHNFIAGIQRKIFLWQLLTNPLKSCDSWVVAFRIFYLIVISRTWDENRYNCDFICCFAWKQNFVFDSEWRLNIEDKWQQSDENTQDCLFTSCW